MGLLPDPAEAAPGATVAERVGGASLSQRTTASASSWTPPRVP